MPEYYFKARDQQGRALSGQRSALSAEDLANQLLSEGLIPLDISVSQIKNQLLGQSQNKMVCP